MSTWRPTRWEVCAPQRNSERQRTRQGQVRWGRTSEKCLYLEEFREDRKLRCTETIWEAGRERWELRGRKKEAEVVEFLFHHLIVSVGKLTCSQPWWSVKIKHVFLTSHSAVH